MCDHKNIQAILDRHPADPAELVGVLHDVQAAFRYLPRPALESVARHLNVPLARVYAVATFYKVFSLKPRGKHRVRVCTGTACHVRGAGTLLDEVEKRLAIKTGETTADMNCTLEAVNCVGACALAPVVMVDDDVHGAVSASSVAAVLPLGGPS